MEAKNSSIATLDCAITIGGRGLPWFGTRGYHESEGGVTMARILQIKELNKSKLPIVRIDDSLEKYKNQVLFKDKLDKANEMLKTVGLPKQRKHA